MGLLTRATGLDRALERRAAPQPVPDPNQLFPPTGPEALATAQWNPPDLLSQYGIVRGGVNWWSGFGTTLTTRQAMSIPSVARGVELLSGLVRQCPIDRVIGQSPVARPAVLDQPDPNRSRAWFIGQQLRDYLVHGNAVAYVTVRGFDGYPLAMVWLPAQRVFIETDATTGVTTYALDGKTLRSGDVIHVPRGADEDYPARGVGIVEQHSATLHRAGDQEAYEAGQLANNGVPSVAVIAPSPQLSQTQADAAKVKWLEKYGGPVREPAILPNGTQVIPLGWSPADSELTAARGMTLTDVANLLNMDGYWLNAPASGMTYRSAGPKYLELLRQTLEPVLADFEGAWSAALLPRGSTVRFDRNTLLADDMQTTVQTWQQATGGALASTNEGRRAMRLPLLEDPAADIVRGLAPEPAPEPTPEPVADPTPDQPTPEGAPS